jgi:hypothetical protein
MPKKKIKEKEITGLLGGGLKRLLKPLVAKFLPIVLSEVDRISRPVKEGGWRQPEDDGLVVLIAKQGDEVLLNVHPIQWSEEVGGMVLKKPLKTHNVFDLLDQGFGVKPPPPMFDEDAQIVNDSKSEEE